MLILLFSYSQPVYWEAWSEHTKVNLLRIVVPVYQIQLNHESPWAGIYQDLAKPTLSDCVVG